jgi:hypothetical protein
MFEIIITAKWVSPTGPICQQYPPFYIIAPTREEAVTKAREIARALPTLYPTTLSIRATTQPGVTPNV